MTWKSPPQLPDDPMAEDDVTPDRLPEHIAIIMDGNGRWARKRGLPRIAGHRAGVGALRNIVRVCAAKGIRVLTVYAFSSENWNRPRNEVSRLMDLFMSSLQREVDELHVNNIRLRFIGDLQAFPDKLRDAIHSAELLTSGNTGLQFVVAANYGGRWDITRACRQLIKKVQEGQLQAEAIDEERLQACLSLADLSDPDLFIRTGGEKRISNYLLWQLAYTELYFTDRLWPEFGEEDLGQALAWYAGRERRFGRTSEQIKRSDHA